MLTGCESTGWEPSTPVNASSPAARLIGLYDIDMDGRLQPGEFEPHADRKSDLSEYDTDGDGALDEAEVRSLLWHASSRMSISRESAQEEAPTGRKRRVQRAGDGDDAAEGDPERSRKRKKGRRGKRKGKGNGKGKESRDDG
jgi:hypothetical protein